MNNYHRYINKSDKILAAICAILPITNVYASPFPGLAIGELLLFLAFLVYILKNNLKLSISNTVSLHGCFIIYSLLISALHIIINSWINIGSVIYECTSKLLTLCLLIVFIKKLKRASFEKYLVVFTDVVVVFFFIQFVLSLLGIRISGIIPFLPLSNLHESSEFIEKQNSMTRLSSLLGEPAHYCEYVYFALLFILFKSNNDLHGIIRIIAYTLSILLTQSANGMAILAIIYGYYIICLKNNKLRIYALLLITLVLGIIVILDPGLLNSVSSRFTDIFMASESGGSSTSGYSSYIRVIRGYIPFIEYETFNKIFGFGWGSLGSWIINNPSSNYLQLTSTIPNWVNTFQLVLLSTGIVGVCLFLSLFYKLYRNNTNIGKCCILVYLALMCSEGVWGFSIIYTIFIAHSEKLLKQLSSQQ